MWRQPFTRYDKNVDPTAVQAVQESTAATADESKPSQHVTRPEFGAHVTGEHVADIAERGFNFVHRRCGEAVVTR